MRMQPRTTIRKVQVTATAALLATLGLAAGSPAAQAQERPGSFRQELTLDVTVLGASVGWAGTVGENTWVGLTLGGGGRTGITVGEDELFGGRNGGTLNFSVELAHLAAFVRHRSEAPVELEAGPRVAWMYHPGTEFETVFVGVYGSILGTVGPVRLGPAVSIGRFEEEAGRSVVGIAVTPLYVRFRLPL